MLLENQTFCWKYQDMTKNFIRDLRKARKLTLQQLADLVGTSNQQISNHESGKRKLTIEWLEKYSAALKCNPVDIISGQTEQDPELESLIARLKNLKPKYFQRVYGAIEMMAREQDEEDGEKQ